MNKSTPVERLAKAVGQATKAAMFCAVGELPGVDPGLAVDGLGAVALPLKRGMGKKLIAACKVAPYGKGTETLVDTNVRSTFELDPKKFRPSDAWTAAIAAALPPIAEQLGLPADRLEARLYKLLVYEKGGFFLPHRDSEKHDRMVASLIVALPNPFEGGTLIVRHGAAEQSLKFAAAAAGTAACYAAFYADCEHEVERVTGGVRLCLAYNLVLTPQRANSSATAKPPADALAESIAAWFAKQPAEPLVFALDHHYTQRGLSLDLLKGADRELADLVISAAAETDCLLHMAQVSRHVSQFADDGTFEEGYFRGSRAPKRHELELGEIYEDDLRGDEWTDGHGAKQPWGAIAFDLSAIVASVPIDDWKPTTEEFEGYTGNAGNTLDRWYHRSAIVLWPRAQHYDAIASSGVTNCLPLFGSMVAKLAKSPKKRLDEARSECVRFARALVAAWPQTASGYWRHRTREKSPCDEFPNLLAKLHDRDAIALFLAKLALADDVLPLSSFVVAACREFGWSAFAQELKGLLSPRPNRTEHDPREIPFRDVEWLAAFCCDPTVDSDKSALARELCASAVQRFCEPPPPQPSYYRREPSGAAASLPLLLEAIIASGRDDDLSRVLRFVRESPEEFRLEECQVPCLKSLIPWSQQHSGTVHPQLASWLVSVRQQLESATAKPPTPPTDWARPADQGCKCEFCAPLKAFLADAANEVGRIPARENIRQHLVGEIDRQLYDVKFVLERKGSPFSLVFTKTSGSFERALVRYEVDLRLLSELPGIE